MKKAVPVKNGFTTINQRSFENESVITQDGSLNEKDRDQPCQQLRGQGQSENWNEIIIVIWRITSRKAVS